MRASKMVAFLFCLVSSIANAGPSFTTSKSVVCSDVKTIIEFLSGEDFREMPNWAGKDENSRYVLMLNEKTKSWTMIQFNDQVACILGAGTDGSILKLKPLKSF